MRTIERRTIPSTDPRLKRQVLHDSESWRYRFDTSTLSIATVEHERRIPILDQGNVGSCTGNAGIGCIGTDPFYATANPTKTPEWANRTQAQIVATPGSLRAGTAILYSLDENGALELYSDAETIDGDGPYPPNDNGSTGLSIAKALKNAGEISGYQHTFSLSDALKALTQYPLISGTNWYNSMFTPSSEGIVTVDRSTGLAGGHEYEVVGYDSARDLVHFANSWGDGWGQQGYFWMSSSDWGELLAHQGDVTVFTPLSQPAPTPTPDPDTELAVAIHEFLSHHHPIGSPKAMAIAGQKWLDRTGR